MKFLQAYGDEAAAGRELTILAVLDLVRRGTLSSGRAAELLGLDRWDMPDLLATYDVDTVEFTAEELEQDRANLRRLGDASD